MKRPGLVTVLGVFFLSGAASASSPLPSAIPSGHPSAIPSASGSPSPTPSPIPSISPQDASVLLREFKKAQATELEALKHRQSLELKELKASQSARAKEWKEKENARRHQFFATPGLKPQDRRAYFTDRGERWKAFQNLQADEYSRRQNEHKSRVAAIEEDQAMKLREFQAFLDRNVRPPTTLWPQAYY